MASSQGVYCNTKHEPINKFIQLHIEFVYKVYPSSKSDMNDVPLRLLDKMIYCHVVVLARN